MNKCNVSRETLHGLRNVRVKQIKAYRAAKGEPFLYLQSPVKFAKPGEAFECK